MKLAFKKEERKENIKTVKNNKNNYNNLYYNNLKGQYEEFNLDSYERNDYFY